MQAQTTNPCLPCRPCPACPRKYKPIAGDGPVPCSILGIAERPGENENRSGRILIGKAGQELDETYLPLAGLSRPEVRFTNIVKCWAEANRTPTDKEVQSCADFHLPAEIEACQPTAILLLGSSACKLVPSIKLERHHGIPRYAAIYDWYGMVVPMYHPAMGLHDSKWMSVILEDWTNLQAELDGMAGLAGLPNLQPSTTDYRLITGQEISNVPLSQMVGVDTESHGARPFSIQISPAPHRGYMVMAEDKQDIDRLSDRLQGRECALHNSSHDLAELQSMGVRINHFRDTMQEAFQACILPQGLKSLTYRLFRHEMTSWEDIVRPDSISALLEWMLEACQIAQADLSYEQHTQLKTKVRVTVKAGELEILLRRLMRHTGDASDYDPWQRLSEFWQEGDGANQWATSHVESRIGKYPILGIGNCSLARAIQYAVGDADWTRQCAVELDRRRLYEGRFEISPEDGDK